MMMITKPSMFKQTISCHKMQNKLLLYNLYVHIFDTKNTSKRIQEYLMKIK